MSYSFPSSVKRVKSFSKTEILAYVCFFEAYFLFIWSQCFPCISTSLGFARSFYWCLLHILSVCFRFAQIYSLVMHFKKKMAYKLLFSNRSWFRLSFNGSRSKSFMTNFWSNWDWFGVSIRSPHAAVWSFLTLFQRPQFFGWKVDWKNNLKTLKVPGLILSISLAYLPIDAMDASDIKSMFLESPLVENFFRCILVDFWPNV